MYISPRAQAVLPRALAWRMVGLILVPAMVVACIWMPFGFRLGGLIEEWDVLGLFNSDHLFFVATIDSPLPVHALRPFTILPHAVAYWLDPDSFFYWHVILITALIAKGASSGFLVWRALGRWGPAIALSVLVIVYPADTMQLSFRALHINTALALVLVGSAIYLCAHDALTPRVRYVAGVSSALALATACGMYEAALPMLVVPWTILLVREGVAGALRALIKRADVALLWFSGAAVYLLYVWQTAPFTNSYQSSLLSAKDVIIKSIPNLFRIGAVRAFLDGWIDAIGIFRIEYVDHVYVIGASALILVCGVFVVRRHTSASLNAEARLDARVVRLALVGLLLMILGYAPFLVSPPHQLISQRTYLFATPGAAMVWVSLMIACAGFARWLCALIAFVLLVFGLSAQLFQFDHYLKISRVQQSILATIVAQYNGDPEKDLIVLDRSNRMGDVWTLGGAFRGALTYLYGHKVGRTFVCEMPGNEWTATDDLARKGSCSESEDAWIFAPAPAVSGPGYAPAPRQEAIVVPKERAVLVNVGEDAGTGLSPPRPPSVDDPVLSRRYRGVLLSVDDAFAHRMFRDPSSEDRVDFDFGRWWSLEKPTRGTGWRPPEWSVTGISQTSFAWKTASHSTLDVEFRPAQKPYRLSGKFSIVLSEPIARSLVLSINGTAVQVVWTEAGSFHAYIPVGVLLPGRNRIEFDAHTDPAYFGLSMALKDFHLHPERR